MLEISYIFNIDNYNRVNELSGSKFMPNFIFYLSMIIVFALIIYGVKTFSEDGLGVSHAATLFGVIIAYSFISATNKQRRELKEDALKGERVDWRISYEELSQKGDDYEYIQKWSDVKSIKKYLDGYLIRFDIGCYNFLPLTVFSEITQREFEKMAKNSSIKIQHATT